MSWDEAAAAAAAAMVVESADCLVLIFIGLGGMNRDEI